MDHEGHDPGQRNEYDMLRHSHRIRVEPPLHQQIHKLGMVLPRNHPVGLLSKLLDQILQLASCLRQLDRRDEFLCHS